MGYINSLSRTYIRTVSRGGYLQTVNTTGGTAEITILGGRTLKWIVVYSLVPINLTVGTVPGGDDLLVSTAIAALTLFPIEIGYTSNGNNTIYFTGTAAGGYIDVYRF